MSPTLDDGLRALSEASQMARTIRVDLDPAYLNLIAQVEARSENLSGTDKTWVWRMEAAFRHFYEVARRLA